MPNPNRTLLAVDTETTSLCRPYLRHGRRIWETAIIRREPDGTERHFHAFTRIADLGLIEMLPFSVAVSIDSPLKHRLRTYLPDTVLKALDVGQFWDRHPEMVGLPDIQHPELVSEKTLAKTLMMKWLTPGAAHDPTLDFLANVPNFDDLGLADLLHRHGWIDSDPPWHYQLVPVEAVAAGALGNPAPPWNSHDLSRRLGVDPDHYRRHTAAGDAQWALDMYDACFRVASEVV
jgi:hypothetical protein